MSGDSIPVVVVDSWDDSAQIFNSLQSQLESLRSRVKELEAENAKLSSHASNCRCCCREMDSTCDTVDDVSSAEKFRPLKNGGNDPRTQNSIEKNPAQLLPGRGYDMKLMHYPSKRLVALQMMYFGQRFYGFASEAQTEPTVESEFFKALEKKKLLLGSKKEIHYSRCGRTDKGVSSIGQVIALYLPSNGKSGHADSQSSGNNFSEAEIDYVRLLNQVLPKDIRVLGWSPVPTGFSARFSCLTREYKYLFWRENLNVMAMRSAARKFVGEHDFRNFCKMDAVNVHNYRRHIISFKICPCSKRFEDKELWAVKVRGSAFLWHQVRCMVAVLFMIGQGLESPNVIDALLDLEKTPKKPQYVMAPEIPLVLQFCEFENIKFTCSSDAKKALSDHMENECCNFELQAAIFHEAMVALASLEHDYKNPSTNRMFKKGPSHVPLMSRPFEPSYEERRAKLNSKSKVHGSKGNATDQGNGAS